MGLTEVDDPRDRVRGPGTSTLSVWASLSARKGRLLRRFWRPPFSACLTSLGSSFHPTDGQSSGLFVCLSTASFFLGFFSVAHITLEVFFSSHRSSTSSIALCDSLFSVAQCPPRPLCRHLWHNCLLVLYSSRLIAAGTLWPSLFFTLVVLVIPSKSLGRQNCRVPSAL